MMTALYVRRAAPLIEAEYFQDVGQSGELADWCGGYTGTPPSVVMVPCLSGDAPLHLGQYLVKRTDATSPALQWWEVWGADDFEHNYCPATASDEVAYRVATGHPSGA